MVKYFGAILVLTSLVTEAVYAKDGRFRCRAKGAEGRSAELRFEEGELRAKWEINVNNAAGQKEGSIVKFVIEDDQFADEIVLSRSGRKFEGDKELSIGEEVVIKNGTPGTIGSLKCTFREG